MAGPLREELFFAASLLYCVWRDTVTVGCKIHHKNFMPWINFKLRSSLGNVWGFFIGTSHFYCSLTKRFLRGPLGEFDIEFGRATQMVFTYIYARSSREKSEGALPNFDITFGKIIEFIHEIDNWRSNFLTKVVEI